MKNILIITLGTREIQFFREEIKNNKDFVIYDSGSEKTIALNNNPDSRISLKENYTYKEFYCHTYPRIAGETILKYYEYYKRIIHLPLIENHLKEQGQKRTDQIILVYTDQKDLNLNDKKQKNLHNNDTVTYKEVIKKLITDVYFKGKKIHISEIGIHRKVADIDWQYNYFARKLNKFLPEPKKINKLFLLAQGGIDQINHALTLQLLQKYGKKVRLCQQSELPENKKQLQFTNLFLKDLIKNQIIAHIKQANYTAALVLLNEIPVRKTKKSLNDIKALFEFGKSRMDFLINDVGHYGKKTFKIISLPEFIKNYKQKKTTTSDSYINYFKENRYKSAFYTAERYFISRYYYDIHNYSRFVLSFAIFIESFCNYYISENSSYHIIDSSGYKVNGERLLRENAAWAEKCKNEYNWSSSPTSLSLPVTLFLSKIIASESNNSTSHEILNILSSLNSSSPVCIIPIDNIRNDIVHRGIGVRDNSIKILSKSGIIEKLDSLIGYCTPNPIESMNSQIIEYIKQLL